MPAPMTEEERRKLLLQQQKSPLTFKPTASMALGGPLAGVAGTAPEALPAAAKLLNGSAFTDAQREAQSPPVGAAPPSPSPAQMKLLGRGEMADLSSPKMEADYSPAAPAPATAPAMVAFGSGTVRADDPANKYLAAMGVAAGGGYGSPQQRLLAMQLGQQDAQQATGTNMAGQELQLKRDDMAMRQKLGENELASREKIAGMQYDPGRIRQAGEEKIIGDMLTAGKSPAEIQMTLSKLNSFKREGVAPNPDATTGKRPTVPLGTVPMPADAAAPAGSSNPYANLTESQLQLLQSKSAGFNQGVAGAEGKPVFDRQNVERAIDAIASGDMTPDMQKLLFDNLQSSGVMTPQLRDGLLRAAAYATINTNPKFGPGGLGAAYQSPEIPGLTLKPAENAMLGALRAGLGGMNDASAYRYAEYGGKPVTLDLADVNQPLFGQSAEASAALPKRLPAIRALLEELKRRGVN